MPMNQTTVKQPRFVLIDFENVQPRNLKLLRDTPFTVMVFTGANQTKIPIDLVESMQRLGEHGEWIRVAGSGRNALDFHIAYYVGKILSETPKAEVHVISRDKGFDPLLQHLKEKDKARVSRQVDIAEIPALRIPSSKGKDEQLAAVIENLKSRGNSRPRKLSTLRNTINHLFDTKLSDAEMDKFINKLRQSKVISDDGSKVTYNFKRRRRK